ncbi:BQ5605_C006g04027 [Microbotryum silenes-dioicae]|uniref:BQ5605_C006g04027 protein n=1 Tax=Microbotryum silenes-dioicae TaxID=796604 RepID=A0A2X0P1N4_9BASI|nr:BQ5605_C006g04027 [Microbotryum silenes-dioicae]
MKARLSETIDDRLVEGNLGWPTDAHNTYFRDNWVLLATVCYLPSARRWFPILTTTQGINGLTPNQIATSRSDTRMRWRCTGADSACNRPDLIARVFEAKSGNKRHAGCFGDECKMNRFCFFAVLRV